MLHPDLSLQKDTYFPRCWKSWLLMAHTWDPPLGMEFSRRVLCHPRICPFSCSSDRLIRGTHDKLIRCTKHCPLKVTHSCWNSPGQNIRVGSLFLLQGIFPTQGWNPGLPHCRRLLYQLSHQGSPRILEWIAYPFSSGSSWPRNKMGSPSLQADSLSTELSGKPKFGTILQEFPRFRAPQGAGLDLCQQSSQPNFSLYLNLLLTGFFTALLNKPCNKNLHLNSVSLDIPQLFSH